MRLRYIIVLKIYDILCHIGWHKWSHNHDGIRICHRCPAVDRYYGLSGLLRYKNEKDKSIKVSDQELRIKWEAIEDKRASKSRCE